MKRTKEGDSVIFNGWLMRACDGGGVQDVRCDFANPIRVDSDVERGAVVAEFHGSPHSSRACLPATKWTRWMPYFGSAARYAVGDSPRTRWKVRLKCVSD